MITEDNTTISTARRSERRRRAELLQSNQYDEQWIVQRTGIHQRQQAPLAVATSDMAFQASLQCLADAGVDPQQVDLILVATMTPDSPMPTTACLLQQPPWFAT